MRKTMEKMKEKKGITLIALVVTIAVILILAGITVGMVTSDNGVLKETKNAKTLAEIDNEKSIVERAKMLTMMRSKNGSITYDVFEPALKEEAGKMPTEVSDAMGTIEVLFTDSNRYYEIDEDGNVSEPQEVVKDKNAGDITKGGRCDGSKEKPYEINCIEDLVVLSNLVKGSGIKLENGKAVEITTSKGFYNENIILTRSLNFKSKYSYADSTRTDFGDINGDDTDGNSLMTEMTTGTGFMPIGNISRNFCGNFDGKYNKIMNLFECADTELGLFGWINSAQIQNIYVNGKVSRANLEKTDMSNAVAGICGRANGNEITIVNCVSNVEIYANNYGVAGILGRGFADSWTVINCANLGRIENKSESTAGIIGRPEGSAYVYNCYNVGDIIGKVNGGTGGIVGDINSSNERIISNVYNAGNIKADEGYGAGGIVGQIRSCTNANINSAYSIGKILGKSTYLGSICAFVRNDATVTIKNSKYKKGICSKIIGNSSALEYEGVTEVDELTGEELVKELNANVAENSGWKQWKLGPDGYPTFIDQ